VPYETFAAADGLVVIGVGNELQWGKFRELLGLPDRAEWRTNAGRVRNYASLAAALGPMLASRTTEAWIAGPDERGIPCGRIRNLAETLDSPELAERGMVIPVDHPEAGRRRRLIRS
jgi:crotonobetainyl-CoA:carnitine CoA-transferase CaiB-like acyl-CoA transferase